MLRHLTVAKAISMVLTSGVLLLSAPARADYTSVLSGGATMTGDADGDTLTFTDGATVQHNRFTEGDADFDSDADFDTTVLGGQTVSGVAVTVNAGDGDDIVDALASSLATSYTLNGEGGNDTLTGSTLGVLDGGDGNDTLFGKLGSDVMIGGPGDDRMVGGDGDDLMFGGDGSDTFEWNPGEDDDTIEGQDGTDVLDFNGSNGDENFDISDNGGRILFFRVTANVTMDLNDVEEIRLETFGGVDTVNAVPFPNTALIIDAGDGDDILNYDCKDGELVGVDGSIQVAGHQPVFHTNFETIVLVDCIFTDADGDGIVGGIDNCPAADNPDQADADADGLGDVCDDDPEGDDVAAGDNCPDAANSGQEDMDGDGVGDACDSDTDGDGTENGNDNCLLIPNADQADADADGFGDACDLDATPPTPPGDEDGDGVTDDADNCTEVENPDQEDADEDGIGDACDCDGEDCAGGGCSLLSRE